MTLTVWARTPDLKRRGQLTVLDGKAVLRDTDVGTWALTVDGASPAARSFSPGWGIQVYEDGQFLLSGPATEITLKYTGNSTTTPDLEISGVTDSHVLADRLVYPSPGKPASGQTDAYYTVKSGNAEDILAGLVNTQAGAQAAPTRRVTTLAAYTSKTRGTTSSVNARFTPLLDEVRAIAQTTGLVVDVVHNTLAAGLELQIRERANRSRAVRFRPGKGIKSVTTSFVAPTANAVLVAGGGQGAARLIKEHTDTTGGWGGRRVERFQDRRDTTEPAELEKAGQETLQEGRGSARATFEVEDGGVYQFGTHFQLGDTVTLDVGAYQVSEPVRVVELSWDEFGRDGTKVTVGDPAAESEETTTPMAQKVRALTRAVQGLSARL